MSTGQTWQTVSTSGKATLKLAAAIGRRLKGGEVIELDGDLGAGKTVFVRGLAEGMGSQDPVSSPSFTLNNQYKTPKLTLHHFDFYRLHEAGIMRQELAEALADPGAVTVVEWAAIIEDVLPAKRLAVKIRATGQNQRQLTFKYPRNLSYLVSANT